MENNIPNPQQQYHSASPVYSSSPSKTFIIVIVIILIAAVGVGGYFLGANKNQIVQNPPQPVIPTTQPSPSTTIDETENWKTISLKKLEFKIPNNWWYESDKNQWYPIEWIDINPSLLSKPRTTVPIFTLRVDTETKSIEEKKKELANTWKLVNIEERSIEKSGVKGIEFWGIADPTKEHYNSRFQKNDKVKIVVFILENEVYHFLGNINFNEREFDQILSTFKFTPLR